MSIVTRQRDAVRDDWMDLAACVGLDPETFWPISTDGQHEAAAYCRRECSVMLTCQRWADSRGIRDGVWGGETEHQRRIRLAKKRPKEKPQRVCAECGNPFCSDACYLLSRLAESTKQRMREEASA